MKTIIPQKDFIIMTIPERNTSIALPDSVKLRKSFLEVVAVGPEVKGIKAGDRVVTVMQAMAQVKLEDDGKERDFYVIKSEFVMGVIAETKE